MTNKQYHKIYSGFKAFTIHTVLLNQPMEFDLYIDNAGRLVKFLIAGSVLSEEKKERLVQNGVDHFYIFNDDSSAFEHYLSDHLGKVLNDPNLNKLQKSHIIYSSAVLVMQEMFEGDMSQTKLMQSREIMQETIRRILASEVTAASIIQISSHDYRTYSHSVNVALYAIGIAHEYGMGERELQDIATGAILHDIGKCRVDQCIINKPGKLTLEEFETMKDHPEHSYLLLLENGETNGAVLEIVRNHHEKLDGSGYSRSLREEEISLATQIVTVADIFDALSSDRAYKKAASFFVALKTMKVQMRSQLNIEVIDSLIRMLGKV
ncbi:MAG: HD-GYP domain-containing protein [Sulfuricurvum sp.]